MTIKESLKWAEDLLNKNKIRDSKISASFLLFQVLNKNLEYIYANLNKKLSLKQEKTYKNWVERRSKHEPVWQIIGKLKFWGMDFIVNQDVLIPRQETEILIQEVLENIKNDKQNISILDIGTGSGAIICALKKELPNSICSASDISERALIVAKKNAKNLNLEIDFKKGDLFEPWGDNKFDIVVTNLPYIPNERLPYLDEDVIRYEPLIALDGGINGTEVYKRFLNQIKKHVTKSTVIYCEIDHTHSKLIIKMAEKIFSNFKIKILSDYANKERFMIIKFE